MAGLGGRTRRARLVLGSSVLFGLVLTGAALAPSFWSAIVLFTVAGCLMALNGIAANTMLQIQAPDHLRGRVMGFYSFVVLGWRRSARFRRAGSPSTSGCARRWRSGGLVCLVVACVVAWRMWETRGVGGTHRADPGAGNPAGGGRARGRRGRGAGTGLTGPDASVAGALPRSPDRPLPGHAAPRPFPLPDRPAS